MNQWLWAASVLTVALGALGLVAIRRPLRHGVVALEAAGTDAALILLLVAEGTGRQPFADLALVLALVSTAGAVAFVRYAQELG